MINLDKKCFLCQEDASVNWSGDGTVWLCESCELEALKVMHPWDVQKRRPDNENT